MTKTSKSDQVYFLLTSVCGFYILEGKYIMWVIVLIANNVSKSSSCSEQISLLEITYEFLVAVFFLPQICKSLQKVKCFFLLSYLFNLLLGSQL